nr:MAG TPA: tail-collar fiber protein [Caudoviricetes sp.]
MAYDLAKVTANGNNLIAQILANKSSLSVDKIEISDTQLPSTTDISTMKSVPKVVQTVSANGFSKNSNTLIISTVVDNSSIRADYKAWVFGIWGSDSQNGQSQLIAVITSTNSPDTIPAFSGRTPVSYTYKFNIGFSNASQIQFNMIDDSFATNDTVVHTTGDETIDGQKKFNTDPTDGAGNAYAKTVDVNQQLDKKVNVADTANWQKYPITDVTGAFTANIGAAYQYKSIKQLLDASNTGCYTTFVNKDASDTPDPLDNLRGIIQLQYNRVWGILTGEFKKVSYYVGGAYNGNTSALNWVKLANDSTVVHSTDMRRPAREVAGIEEVNAKQDKIGYTPADDSKVAHLSGANNFDTVPTVDNNPLLLASSLPSDLARTGQAQTFTAAQTFSIAPTITDASTDKGDNQAATMADLKSVEESAWHQLKDHNLGGTLLYKIDQSSKRIYVSYSLNYDKLISSGSTIADFSSIVKNIKTISGTSYCVYYKEGEDSVHTASIINLSIGSPASIVMSDSLYGYLGAHMSFSAGTYFTYDSLR